jgi:RNA ligase
MREPESIESIDDIRRLATRGFKDWKRYGEVYVGVQDDLLIFNYTTRAQYAARWNFFEVVSRGLIINYRTGEIVARPFEKFFNWLEGGRHSRGHMVSVTEKIDGSLGVLYRTQEGYKIATRGSFTGLQAEWATKFLNTYYDLTGLPDELTLLFEIIFPENRNVAYYNNAEDLILLAARNRHTGDYCPFFPTMYEMGQAYNFTLPHVYDFNNIAQIIERTGQLGPDSEGYVVEFSDGSRFKFKGDRYLELQKLIMGLTYRNILKSMSLGIVHHIRDNVPEEHLVQVNLWIAEIENAVEETKGKIKALFATAPKESRKGFAIWAQTQDKDIAPFLFKLFDREEIEPLIYKMLIEQLNEREARSEKVSRQSRS